MAGTPTAPKAAVATSEVDLEDSSSSASNEPGDGRSYGQFEQRVLDAAAEGRRLSRHPGLPYPATI